MDKNQNNFRNGNGNGEKEEIRFDERDFQNPYSKYYSQSSGDSSQSTDSDFGNPYSRYYNNSDTNQNGGDRTESEPIDFGTYNRPGKTYLELQKDKKNFSRIGFGYVTVDPVNDVRDYKRDRKGYDRKERVSKSDP